jgi:lysophospholipase L1-like esterase
VKSPAFVKLGSLLANTGLLFTALAVSVLLFEGALRLIDYQYTPLRIKTVETISEWRYYHAFEDDNFVYDPELFWRPRRGSGFFNEQGYRGNLLAEAKQPGNVRIFAIGDSNTLGWSGASGPHWPAYLEQLFAENGQNVTVTNAGVYGYTSFQGLRRFKETLKFAPDIVLISFGANDALRVTMSDAEFANRKVRSLNWDKALMRTRIGQMVLNCVDNFSNEDTKRLAPRVTLEEYKTNLNEIIRISAVRQIKAVLLTRPFYRPLAQGAPQRTPFRRGWNFAPRYNELTLELADRAGVPAVDVYSFFKGCTDCFVDEYHFSEKGMRQMAELLYEKIHTDVEGRATSSLSRALQ